MTSEPTAVSKHPTQDKPPVQEAPAVLDDQAATSSSPLRRIRRFRIEEWGTILFFLLFFIAVGILRGDTFLSFDNLFTALAQNGHLAFIAVAATITLINGQFDLSIGAIAGLCAVLTAGLTSKQGFPIWLAILCALLAGIVVGLINGLLVTKLKINVFIATLGMSGVLAGVGLVYAGGQVIYQNIPEALTNLGRSFIADIFPTVIILPVLMTLVMWFIAKRTVLGRRWYAVGSSPLSSRLAGVNVDRTIILSLVTAGVLSALAGVVLTMRFGSVDPTIGPGFLLPAYAAAFLGSAILSDGRFSVVGAVVATFLVALAESGLLQLGLVFAEQIFNGAVLVGAVALNELLRRRALSSMDSRVRAARVT